MGAFDLLSEDISSVLTDLGIEEETRPQEDAIPPILDGKNTLVIAPTGIGKTEAALLPILENILKNDTDGFALLYITPLKALNRDMIRRVKEFSDRLNFDVGVRHGDTTRKERRKQAENPPEVLITTPETLQIMFTGKKLRKGLENVEHVVVDELNELAEDERGSQLSLALERLAALSGRDFQRVGLSATVGSPEKVRDFLVGEGRKGVIVETAGERELDVRVEKPVIEQERDKELSEVMRCDVEKAAALRLCKDFIEEHQSTLFFVNTRDAAETLSSSYTLWRDEFYSEDDFPIGVHHGSLSKEARIEMEERFKEGSLKGLICTSSMELGIDVGRTDLVLQYQSPRQVTRLIQRIGRSGHRIGEVSKGRIIATTMDDVAEAAVISEKAIGRDLERTEIPEEPLSVLANQLISTVHTEKELDTEKFFRLVKRAYPFRGLEEEVYKRLLEQLAEIGVIWKDEEEGLDKVGKRRASLNYFYDNISMIPDEKTYIMRDVSDRSIIGSLDEGFVASNVAEGEVITLQGKAWRIVELEEEEVLVEKVGNIGRIPDWTGEEIPVPYEVAKGVGQLREKGLEDQPVSEEARKQFSNYRERQGEREIATADKIVIELEEDTAVVNACFGTQINETLGHMLASLLSARLGESVPLQIDPYRIMMKLPRRIEGEVLESVLNETDPRSMSELLEKVMERSNFFKWKFLHVGKKFGAIEKDADWRKINMDRIIKTFRGTLLYEEAVSKIFRDSMDLEGTKEVLNKIQSGTIRVVLSEKGISPMGEAGLEKHKEFLSPDKVSKAVLDSLKERLESEKMIMKCLRCGNRRRKRVEDVDKPKCPECGSSMVAPLHPYQDESIVDKDDENLDSEERKELKKYYKLAELARVHKKRALMALSARGVGHQNAGRILSRRHRDEDEFLKDILEAEIRYARTKRFWD
ncbi:MAG: DEAD/DEAH box helicase [Candidatus Thermoplasmatota archaeon]